MSFIECTACFIPSYGCRIDEIRIIVKDRVEDQYLKLEELGEVLRQLSHEFPGR